MIDVLQEMALNHGKKKGSIWCNPYKSCWPSSMKKRNICYSYDSKENIKRCSEQFNSIIKEQLKKAGL